MANSKAKVKVKVEPKKGKKPVKPKFNNGKDGGFLTAKIVATVNKNKK